MGGKCKMLNESDKILLGVLKNTCPTTDEWQVKKNSFETIVYQFEFESFFDNFGELVGNRFYQETGKDQLIVGVTKSTLKQIIITKLSDDTMGNAPKIERFVKREDNDYDIKKSNSVFIQDNLRLMKLSPYDHYSNDICICTANTQSKKANNIICDKIIEMLNNDVDSVLTLMDSADDESDD